MSGNMEIGSFEELKLKSLKRIIPGTWLEFIDGFYLQCAAQEKLASCRKQFPLISEHLSLEVREGISYIKCDKEIPFHTLGETVNSKKKRLGFGLFRLNIAEERLISPHASSGDPFVATLTK